MKTVTLRNDFHGTEFTMRFRDAQNVLRPSQYQIERCRRELCGITGCSCGGALSQRGAQDVVVEEDLRGVILICDDDRLLSWSDLQV